MKRRAMRQIVSMFAGVAALTAAGFVAAQPANAADVIRCNSDTGDENEFNFNLPAAQGQARTPVKVVIDLCVGRDDPGSHRAAWARQVFWNGSDGVHPPVKRFNAFSLQVRLERYDAIQTVLWCDFTSDLNYWTDSSYSGHGFDCVPGGWDVFTAQAGWTADATVHYDIAYDGKGEFLWDLHGTPSTT